jgi:AraC-like DNA-binding protein
MGFSVKHHAFQATVPGEATQFVENVWERHKFNMTGERYGLRWSQFDLDHLSLSYIENDGAIESVVEGKLSDQYRIRFHRQGAIQHTINGQKVVSDTHKTVVQPPSASFQQECEDAYKVLLISFQGDYVRSALKQRFSHPPAEDFWAGELPPSPWVETLQSMSTWLYRELTRPDSPLAASQKPRLHAEQMLRAAFVECLASLTPEDGAVVPEIGEQQVRRAEEWIDHHLTEPIGAEEVARAMGVGVRSLQRTFKRCRGHTPTEAILRRRLERVHQALSAAGPGSTVTAIATGLGFVELGRFAIRYKARFGESPSETLARDRAFVRGAELGGD